MSAAVRYWINRCVAAEARVTEVEHERDVALTRAENVEAGIDGLDYQRDHYKRMVEAAIDLLIKSDWCNCAPVCYLDGMAHPHAIALTIHPDLKGKELCKTCTRDYLDQKAKEAAKS